MIILFIDIADIIVVLTSPLTQPPPSNCVSTSYTTLPLGNCVTCVYSSHPVYDATITCVPTISTCAHCMSVSMVAMFVV